MNGQKQIEITEQCLLLDEDGCPAFPGYCRRNLYLYNKERIRKGRFRIKEWDFYQITDGRYKVELTFFNISAMAALTAAVVDLQSGKTWSDVVIEPSTPDKYRMSPAADAPFVFSWGKSGKTARFETGAVFHRLLFRGKTHGKPFEIRVEGNRLPDQESLTVLTPFRQKHSFFLTQKLNCITVKGRIRIGSETIYLDPEKAFMVMDWARGVWPYRNMWYWSNASTILDGKRFGFELTWGFGDESKAAETALFYDGKCHKIGRVHLESDPEKAGWLKPWHFIAEDGRLDLTLTPAYTHKAGMIFAGLLGHKSNQVYGNFNGFVILDDGTRLAVRDMFGFAEKVHNRW